MCMLALIASPFSVIAPSQPHSFKAHESGDNNPPRQNSSKPAAIADNKSTPKHSDPSPATTSTGQPSNSQANLSDGAVVEKDRILTRDGRIFPIRQYKPTLSPNDTYANQWWAATNGMNAVWDMSFGARQTKVAIIDTGFALNHQEFANRWAINSGESGSTSNQGASKLNCTDQALALNKSCNNIDDNFDGIVDNEFGAVSRQNPSFLNCTDQARSLDRSCNRLDDDKNGLVDDYRGWDFASFDNSSQAGQTNPDGSGTTHGTMVAGVLGATGNNGIGLAGVNWYSTILPIQALNDDSYGDSYTVGESIYYAADQGADVISISLGTSADDPYLRLAIRYAMDKGAIVVAASGNDGCNCISYPANYPEVIAVGAIDSSNNPAGFSNYGSRLDVLAPGAGITTSTWTKTNQGSAYAANAAGTSFATPFVSGLLGLARSYQPDATWEEIVGAMLENSDRRSLTASTPRNDQLGYGVTRASTMLARLKTPAQPVQRYQLGGAPVFGSARTYQCENTLPASMLYELTIQGQLRYTASPFENYNATLQGWTSRETFYTCIGLPTDQPGTLRMINLPAEIKNNPLNTKF